jgi:hypothetical protein
MPGFWIPLMVGLQAPDSEYRLPAGTALVRQMIRLVTNTAEVSKAVTSFHSILACGQARVKREAWSVER